MPFDIQPIHILVIIAVALLVFGPQKLPELGRGLGKAISEFRKGTREMTDSFHEEVTHPGAARGTVQPTQPPSDSNPPGLTPATPNIPISTQAPSSTPAGRFCVQCGTPNRPQARFCSHCGAKLPERTA